MTTINLSTIASGRVTASELTAIRSAAAPGVASANGGVAANTGLLASSLANASQLIGNALGGVLGTRIININNPAYFPNGPGILSVDIPTTNPQAQGLENLYNTALDGQIAPLGTTTANESYGTVTTQTSLDANGDKVTTQTIDGAGDAYTSSTTYYKNGNILEGTTGTLNGEPVNNYNLWTRNSNGSLSYITNQPSAAAANAVAAGGTPTTGAVLTVNADGSLTTPYPASVVNELGFNTVPAPPILFR